ncbi:uncharacterized protein LOC134203318 [Armigeres subalbatus]|uniref:uncharacterized protein LOC134203318 n=1 Tax=Armigeres subalbatus TaxID=124917 RepID=UPI002ED4B738
MTEMQPLHDILINNRKSVPAIFKILPHFKSYNGAMIRKASERMNANYNRDSDLKKVFMFGLILEKGTFKYVKNDHVRGCLRIMAQLSRKGIKKPQFETPMTVEEELAAPLIRSIEESPSSLAVQLAKYAAIAVERGAPVPPHIINQGNVFVMFVEGQVISLGTCSVQAIDTFVKFFDVFKYKVPVTLTKFVELVEIV